MRKTGLAALLVSIGSVKREVFMLLTVFCLFIVSCPFSGYAAGPDGFANVPWGATRSQVDQAMAQQGFRSEGQLTNESYRDGSIGYSYQGTLAGFNGHLKFWFLNGTFFRGQFTFEYNDGGVDERNAFNQFLAVITSKYGSPTRSVDGPQTGGEYMHREWAGLQAPGASDTVHILLRCNLFAEDYASYFNVAYTNSGVVQRLAVPSRNGL